MGFRGREFSFDSPAAAINGLIARVRADAVALDTETVEWDAPTSSGPVGRILAEDVRADRDSPAFDHSAMDGYAVRADTLAPAGSAGPRVVPVIGESRIGHEPPRLAEGLVAVRIATGAAMPHGADTVIRREDVAEHAQGGAGDASAEARCEVRSIEVSPHVASRLAVGQHVRRRAENAGAGSVVLHAGEVISAAGLGTIATVGITRPRVFRRLRVAVITTGGELVPPTDTPSAFQTRNSNASSIHAILASQRWAEVVTALHACDEDDLDGMVRGACDSADAVVLTGGVSMGHRDPVREAVEAVGADIVFHGLPQRPGKPMLGAVLERAMTARPLPIFGLPGNPVSALVTCTRIVIPVLAACSGARRTLPGCLPRLVHLGKHDGRTLDLWWHRLVRLSADEAGAARADLIDGRGSGDLIAAGLSDGFVEVPPAASPALVPFYPWPCA